MKIAVLALQGAFIEHERMLTRLGIESFEVRQYSDWANQEKDGLIIPGGESTVQLKLLKDLNLLDPIRREIENGLPVFGTCAGLILLAKSVRGEAGMRISTMDIEVCRNAYGRQLGSFYVEAPISCVDHDVPMTFIRAPYIISTGEGCQVLAKVNDRIVAARQGNQLVTAFHPELNEDCSIHQYFVDMVAQSKS